MRRRILHILIAIDQLAWVVLTLGNGYPDETISSAAYRSERKDKLFGKIFRPFIDMLFLPLEKDHCRKAYEAEIYNKQLPNEFDKYL